MLAIDSPDRGDSAYKYATDSEFALAERQVHTLVSADLVGLAKPVKVPLTTQFLHLIPMCKCIRVHFTLMNIIIVEFNLADTVLIVLIDCEKVVIHKNIGYHTELPVVVSLSFHVLHAEVQQVLQ